MRQPRAVESKGLQNKHVKWKKCYFCVKIFKLFKCDTRKLFTECDFCKVQNSCWGWPLWLVTPGAKQPIIHLWVELVFTAGMLKASTFLFFAIFSMAHSCCSKHPVCYTELNNLVISSILDTFRVAIYTAPRIIVIALLLLNLLENCWTVWSMIILNRKKNLSAKTSSLHLYLDMFFRNMEVSQSELSEFSSVWKGACFLCLAGPPVHVTCYIRVKVTFDL